MASGLPCYPVAETLPRRDQTQFLKKYERSVSGIFLGYALMAVRIWKGDIMVADIEELGSFGRVGNPRPKAQRKGSNHVEKR